MKNSQLPSEHLEQVSTIQWYDRVYNDGLLFAIPNGGKRHPKVAAEMKLEGVRSGVPDLFLPVPAGGHHGLFIEMKRQKGGRVSPEQKQWLEYLRGAGYLAVVCKGFEEAKEAITDYLEIHLRRIPSGSRAAVQGQRRQKLDNATTTSN